MKYHAPTKCFVLSPADIEQAARGLLNAIKHIRLQAELPLEPYAPANPMQSPQFAEQGIIDAALSLGIDLGSSRYGALDVRNAP